MSDIISYDLIKKRVKRFQVKAMLKNGYITYLSHLIPLAAWEINIIISYFTDEETGSEKIGHWTCDFCPSKNRLGCRFVHAEKKRPCEDMVKSQASAGWGKPPQKKPSLSPSWS